MKKIIILKNAQDISDRLSELGLTVELLQEAAKANFLAQANCTANDAPTFPGTSGWNASVRVLRENLATQGWVRNNHKNSPRISSPSGGFSIMVATGDHFTGTPIGSPKTKSNKGASTRASVNDNAKQATLFDLDEIPQVIPLNKFKENSNNHSTWVLLVYVEVDKDTDNPNHSIRCELSLPVEMDDAGYINTWSERILIPEIDFDPYKSDKAPDETEFAQDKEIVIKRKK